MGRIGAALGALLVCFISCSAIAGAWRSDVSSLVVIAERRVPNATGSFVNKTTAHCDNVAPSDQIFVDDDSVLWGDAFIIGVQVESIPAVLSVCWERYSGCYLWIERSASCSKSLQDRESGLTVPLSHGNRMILHNKTSFFSRFAPKIIIGCEQRHGLTKYQRFANNKRFNTQPSSPAFGIHLVRNPSLIGRLIGEARAQSSSYTSSERQPNGSNPVSFLPSAVLFFFGSPMLLWGFIHGPVWLVAIERPAILIGGIGLGIWLWPLP